jgi:hypothetical protein
MQSFLEKECSTQLETERLQSLVWNDEAIQKIVSEFKLFLQTPVELEYEHKGEKKVREDLIEVYEVLSEIDAQKVFTHLFCTLWQEQECMIQVLVGSLWYLPIESTFRKTSAIEIILAIFARSPLVEVDMTRGESVMFRCKIPFKREEEVGFILPSITPPIEVTDNYSIGYREYFPSLILSTPHDKEVNYAHINRTNAVQYELEKRLTIQPHFKVEPKVKKNGEWEKDEDILLRYQSFKDITESIPKRRALLERHTTKFFLCHSYDCRGRIYPKAYEFNYQGIKYIKALINLAHKEIIGGEF